MHRASPSALAWATIGVLVLAGCGAGTPRGAPPDSAAPSSSPSTPRSQASATDSPRPSGSPRAGSPSGTTSGPTSGTGSPGTVPPAWLGTRVLPHEPGGFGEVRPTPRELTHRRFTLPDTLPPLPGRGFASAISPVPRAVLDRSTWRPGCPVQPRQLRWIRVAFWGFDQQRHTGELLANAQVADDLVQVFAELYRARFPLERMRITTTRDLDAPPTGDGNDTGAFACRPITGGSGYSQHAYGLAVDLNPFQNPYEKGAVVVPELAGSYLDRGRQRPGMIQPGDVVTRAFARIGWGWGGAWRSLKDYQHFSQNGR